MIYVGTISDNALPRQSKYGKTLDRRGMGAFVKVNPTVRGKWTLVDETGCTVARTAVWFHAGLKPDDCPEAITGLVKPRYDRHRLYWKAAVTQYLADYGKWYDARLVREGKLVINACRFGGVNWPDDSNPGNHIARKAGFTTDLAEIQWTRENFDLLVETLIEPYKDGGDPGISGDEADLDPENRVMIDLPFE
jgi:hypothetical protein